ncbi:MAG: hypothetical protein WCG81_04705 [Candidatus Angelobacter sp.]
MSSNGQFLVLADAVMKPGSENNTEVKSISFQVFPRERFINAKDKLSTPATYWTNWARWSIVVRPEQLHSMQGCPVPLISDDGEFLLLLQTGFISANDHVLEIYRCDHSASKGASSTNLGVFVKGLSLKEFWPTSELPSRGTMWTDESPQWFADGSFIFSSDDRQLIHKTRWGNSVRINLTDRSVSAVADGTAK